MKWRVEALTVAPVPQAAYVEFICLSMRTFKY